MKRERAKELRQEATPAEESLWAELRKLDASFTRQFVIDGFTVDFCCRSARIVVEVDGGIHDEQQSYDAARDQLLVSAGYRVVRVTNENVLANAAAVAADIRQLLVA